MSAAVCAVRNALAASVGEAWGEGEAGEGGDVPVSPSPAPAHHDDSKLTHLMQRQR